MLLVGQNKKMLRKRTRDEEEKNRGYLKKRACSRREENREKRKKRKKRKEKREKGR
jgi:hypothetical protein